MKKLQGKKILITRDASQSGSLKEKLTNLGAEVISIPTIKISDPPTWQLFDQAAESRNEFDWIVFTSINAVTQTQKRLTELSVDNFSNSEFKIAAVGSQTAKTIEKLGWSVDLVPDKFQAEDLGEKLLASDLLNKRIWMPRALKVRNVLVSKLEEAGAVIMVTPVYENTIPLENRQRLQTALSRKNIDWVTFTSSSTVTNFFKLAGDEFLEEKLPKIASIGEITTQALSEFSLKTTFTAKPQNLEGLCQGILNWECTE